MIFITFATAFGSVVQLDRIADSGSVGWGFESPRGHCLSILIACKTIICRRFFFVKGKTVVKHLFFVLQLHPRPQILLPYDKLIAKNPGITAGAVMPFRQFAIILCHNSYISGLYSLRRLVRKTINLWF